MISRLNPFTASPDIAGAWSAFGSKVEASGLEKPLIELVKIRSSLINGCANCLNMHTFEARQAGESEQRVALLGAWHEAPCYSERERAALAWTDHVTLIADKRAPDEVYAALDAQFSKDEQVKLTMAIIVINGWNRLAVAFNLFNAGAGWKV